MWLDVLQRLLRSTCVNTKSVSLPSSFSGRAAVCRALRKLSAFVARVSIVCVAATASAGTISLTWQPPTQNTDGTALLDLASYRIYSGCTSPGQYANSVTVMAPASAYSLTGLPDTGTCYAAMSALNSKGAESVLSNEVSKFFGTLVKPDTPSVGPQVAWSKTTMSMSKLYSTTVGGAGSATSIAATIDSTGYTHAVVYVKHEGVSVSITLSDNKSSPTWNSTPKVTHANGDIEGQLFWVKIGSPGASHTITATLGASRAFRAMVVYLINASGNIEQDAEAHASGTGTAVDAGTLSTTGVSVLSFMITGPYNTGSHTPSTGWTEDFDTAASTVNMWAGSRGPETTTPIDPAETWTLNDAWVTSAISFREVTSGAMVGSSTLTFAASGSLTGSGALSGPSTLTFTPSGSLGGSGALAGPSTLTFTPSGTLAGAGAMTAASTLTFTGAGTLAGAGALAGGSTLTFTVSGTLNAPSGAMVGNATLTFTPTGTVAGSGALAGNVTLTFTPNGTLIGAGALAGASTLTFTPNGAVVGAGALAGATTITFTPTGAVLGAGSLSGSASLLFTLTGLLVDANAPIVQINPITAVAMLDVVTGVKVFAVTDAADPLLADRRVIH